MTAVSENKSQMAFDPVFPRRDEVLNSGAMRENFAFRLGKKIDSCEIARVKYRPLTSLRILYRIKTGGAISLFAARVFQKERARKIIESLKDQSNIFFDENLQTVFWKFPSDRKIRQLEKIGKLGCRNELVAYAPEKCATFRFFNRRNEIFAYAKVFADGDEGARVFSIYKNLQNPDDALFPKVACFSAKHKTLFVEAVEGVRLADLRAADLPQAFRLFGAVIARFHELKPPRALPEFKRHDPETISATLSVIERIKPENFLQAENLARKLMRETIYESGEKVTLHGDVHAKNAILQPDGKLVLIDLDQTCAGSAAFDIGSFLAGLFYKELIGEIPTETRENLSQNFLAGYEKIRSLPDERSLKRHAAAAIFTERCGRAINRFRREGLEKIGALLSFAAELCENKTL